MLILHVLFVLFTQDHANEPLAKQISDTQDSLDRSVATWLQRMVDDLCRAAVIHSRRGGKALELSRQHYADLDESILGKHNHRAIPFRRCACFSASFTSQLCPGSAAVRRMQLSRTNAPQQAGLTGRDLPVLMSPRSKHVAMSRADWTRANSNDWPSEASLLDAQQQAKLAAAAMARAVAREDYKAAAQHKKDVEAFRRNDPVWTLRSELRAAVASEQFGRAGECQAALHRLRNARPKLLWRDALLVLRERRQIWIYPDGGSGVLLYTSPSNCELALPTWSPDGNAVGLAESCKKAGSRVFVLSAEDGTEIASLSTQPVVYLAFTPDGRALTFLQASPSSVAQKFDASCRAFLQAVPTTPLVTMVSMLDVTTNLAMRLRTGGLVYYAIGPQGGLLEHDAFLGNVTYTSGGDFEGYYRMGRVGSAKPIELSSGSVINGSRTRSVFRAPVIEQSGRYAAFVSGQKVVGVDLRTSHENTILELSPGTVGCVLVLSSDGCRLAVLLTTRTQGMVRPETELFLLSAHSALDLFSGLAKKQTLPSSKDAIVGMVFSPDSTKLLCLDADLSGPGPTPVAWAVWFLSPEGRQPSQKTFKPFQPTLAFAQAVVPLFDLFAQSATPWSPDSSAFCYAQRDGSVVVQRLPTQLHEQNTTGVPQAELIQGSDTSYAKDAPADIAIWSPC